jgi:hypothetical protein
MTIATQIYCIVDPAGNNYSPAPNTSFKEMFAHLGVENFGPLLKQGWAIASVMRVPRQEIRVIVGDTTPHTALNTCLNLLTDIPGVETCMSATVLWKGNEHSMPINDISSYISKPRPAKKPIRIVHPEILRTAEEYCNTLDTNTKNVPFQRVIWTRDKVLEANDLGEIGLTSVPGVFGIHVTNDPEFWFTQLVNDYDRDEIAYLIEIIGQAGDVLVEDPQYCIPPEVGEKADSSILLVSRNKLIEGRDFCYVRTLTEQDLIDNYNTFDHDALRL